MKNPIRVRYFFWLTALLVAFLLINSLTLLAINLPEIVARGPDWKEEFFEWLVITITGLAVLPLALLLAWRVSRHLLTPLRTIANTAHRIEAGHLTDRIAVPETHDEIAELAKALNRALDRYEAAIRRQQQFSATASHQLRTPLTTIRSLGEIALQKERDGGAYRRAIESILEVSGDLAQVVEQLLLLTSLSEEEVRSSFLPVSITELFASVCDRYAPYYEEKHIQVSSLNPEDCILHAQPDLLLQALGNVLDNAIRHTPPAGHIRLEARFSGADCIALSVSDSGPGFAACTGAHVSERGTGLGLLIVDSVVRLHHGQVQQGVSDMGGGKISLMLPLYTTADGRDQVRLA